MMLTDDIEELLTFEQKDGKRTILGINRRTGELMKDGVPLVTRYRISLSGRQKAAVAIIVASAALGGLYALIQIVDWVQMRAGL